MTDTSTKTRRDATENRAALLASARIELNADPNASLETIASAAGLSRRAVYGHFANRDELLRELLTTGSARVADAVGGSGDPDPVVDLALVAGDLWREVESMRVMTLFAVRGPFKELTVDGLAPLRKRVLDDVTGAQEAGSIRDDIPAPILAHLIEEGALMVLDEQTSATLAPEEGHLLIMQTVLALAGLGWREANDFITSTPELNRGAA